jgi:hypothetical protein
MLLMTPGAYTGSPARNWPHNSTITGYFEDSENRNNNDDDFVTPTATNYNRDRIYTLP